MSQKDEVERIVSMKFDNGQFEKGVSTSLKTIDQLKKSLDFSETEKSLASFQNSGKNFDVSGIVSGIEKIESHFSFLGQAVLKIKNGILDDVAEIGRSVKGIMGTGWGKYEQETAAVQTMMGNMTEADLELYMLAQGKIDELGKNQLSRYTNDEIEQDKIDYIEKNLERITWFADETSYSYDDMTSSLAKFLASGGKIEESTSAVIGLAVAAADAGVSTTNASRAYYNFAQAISAGRMRLQDWNSIVQLNMNTPKFMQNLIDTAVEVGTLAETTDGLYTVLTKSEKAVDDFSATMGFGESLAGNWMTSEVMFKAFEMYGSYADMLYEVQKEMDLGTVADAASYLDELGISYAEVAKVGFDAAQNTKTFTEAVDFLKDALSTQFKGVYKTIFGGFIEARDLWSELSEIFYNNLVAPMENFNDLLSDWAGREEGGRDSLITAFGNGIEYVVQLLSVFREAAAAAFPNFTADRLAELTLRFEKWTANLKMSDERFAEVRDGLAGILKFIRAILIDVKDLFNFLKPAGKQAGRLIVTIISRIGKLLGKIADADERIGNLGGALEICSEKLNQFRDMIKETTGIDLRLPKWKEITDSVKQLTARVKELTGVDLHLPTWKDILDLLIRFKDKIEDITGIDFHKPTWDGFVNTVRDVIQYLEQLLNIDFKMPTLDEMAESIANVVNSLRDFKDSLGSAEENTEKLSISDRIVNGWHQLGDVIDTVRQQIRSLFSRKTKDDAQDTLDVMASSGTNTAWGNFKDRLLQIVETIKGPISQVTMGDLLGFGMIGSIIRLIWQWSGLIKGGKTIAEGLGGLLKSVGDGVKSFLEKIGGGWGDVGTGIKTFFDKLGTTTKAKNWKTRAAGFKDMAIALGIIVASIVAMTYIADEKDIWKAIGIVSALLIFILTVSLVLDKIDTKGTQGFTLYKSGNRGFLGVAVGIAALLLALRIFKDFTVDEIWRYFGIVAAYGALLTAMVGLSKIGGKGGLANGVAFFLAAAALQKMAKVLEKFDGLDLEHRKRTLELLAGAVLALAVVTRALKNIKFGSGMGLIGITVGISILVGIMKNLSKADLSNLRENQGILWALGGILALITILNAIFSRKNTVNIANSNKNSVKIANNMLGIGLAFMLMTLSLKMVSKTEFEHLGDTIWMMLLLMGGLAVLMWVASSATKDTKQAGKTAVKIAFAIGLMSGALVLLHFLKIEDIEKGVLFFGVMEGLLFAIIKAASKYQRGVKSITELVLVLTALIGFSWLLADFQPEGMEKAVLEIAGLMLAMSAVIAAASKIKNKEAWAAAGITLALGAVGTGITFALSKWNGMLAYDWQSILSYMGGLATIIVAMAAACWMLSQYENDWKKALTSLIPLGGFVIAFGTIVFTLSLWSSKVDPEAARVLMLNGAVLIGAIGGVATMLTLYENDWKKALTSAGIVATLTAAVIAVMYHVSKWSGSVDPEGALSLMAGASLLIIAIGAAAVLTAAAGVFSWKGLIGAVVVLLLIAGLFGIIYAVGAWFKAEDIQNAVTIMTLLGQAIGGFVGGIVAGFDEAKTETAGKIADNLTTFAEKIKGFYPVADAPGEKLKTNAQNIYDAAKSIKDMADIKIKEDSDVPTHLTTYAAAIAGFGNMLGEIDNKGYSRMKTVTGLITEITAALTAAYVPGNIENVGIQMASYGESLKDFILDVSWITEDNVQQAKWSAEILSMFAEAAQKIPNGARDNGKGNFLSAIVGDNDVDSFGEKMKTFSECMKTFILNTSWVTEDSVTRAGYAAQILSTMSSAAIEIPNGERTDGKGNFLSWLVGDNDIDTFGENMVSYSESLAKFSSNMSGVGTKVVGQANIASLALTKMAAAAGEIPNAASSKLSVFTFFTGKRDSVKTFGENMVDFASSLGSFVTYMKEIGTEDLEWATTWVSDIFNMLSTTTYDNGENIYAFGGALTTLAEVGIENFVSAFAGSEETVKNAYDTFFMFFSNAVDDESKKREIAFIFSGFLNVIIGGINGRHDDFVIAGENTIQGFLDGVKTKTDSISEADGLNPGDILATIILTALQSANPDFLGSGSELIQNAMTGMMESISGIPSAGHENPGGALADRIHGGYSEGSAGFYDNGKHSIQQFMDGITQKIEAIPNTVTENPGGKLAKVLLNGYTANTQDFVRAGENTVLGVLQGVKQETDKIPLSGEKNPGENLARIVKNGFDKYMIIKSPSQLMYQSGVFTVKGLEEGLTAEESALGTIAADLGETVSGGIEAIFPTIENAAKKIDSLLGTNLTDKAENLKNTIQGYAGAASGLGDQVQNGLTGIVSSAIEALTGKDGDISTLVTDTLGGMFGEIQGMMDNGFSTELDITPVLDMTELQNSITSEFGNISGISGLFDFTDTAAIAEDAIASGLGTNDLLADELSGLRGDVQGFYQAYMDDDGIDTDEIARAAEAGVASGLSKATVSIDGTTAGKVVSNKQNTYERANGGSKVVATWYR